jgi:uncharacterized membrane protein YdjX (TVP38/TMEM64 family)
VRQQSGATEVMVPALRIPKRLIAPIVLIVLAAAIWASGVTHHLSWSALAEYHAALTTWIAAWPWLAPLLFVVFYSLSVTLSLPQAGLMTMAGGLLFGTIIGGALAVTGATIGAVSLFLIARSAFADSMARRGGATLGKLRDELRRNGFSYLLAIRLVPIFPFWLINLAAALCGMRLADYAIATLIGIMPTTFILASIGAGLGQVLARGETPTSSQLFSWQILGPLMALAVVSLIPVIWRKWRARDA